MQCEVVVRRATREDEPARAQLVRQGFSEHNFEAFLFFFFQEVTLQGLVLCGAVLFIFCGLSAPACALCLPAAAALVAAAVRLTHSASAESHVQGLRKENIGYVAELHGPLLADPKSLTLRIRLEHEQSETVADTDKPYHKTVLGTVSVSEFWGPSSSGWLHDLVVMPEWRRRGVGRALACACRRHAALAGLQSLEAATSCLQAAARHLLHDLGWECRGSYHRPLCANALSLPVARLGTDLPYA